MSKKMPARSAKKLFSRLKAIDAKCKACYAESDAITARLIEALQAVPSRRIDLGGDAAIVLKDNFADRDGNPRNKAFKTTAISRYDVVLA